MMRCFRRHDGQRGMQDACEAGARFVCDYECPPRFRREQRGAVISRNRLPMTARMVPIFLEVLQKAPAGSVRLHPRQEQRR